MTSNVQQQVELSAILNLVPYLDEKILSDGPMTLQEIVDTYESSMGNDKTFKLLKAAVDGNEYGKIELVNQSSTNDSPEWTDDLIQGCTFRDSDGNYYVAFRGTGDGRWPDNGDGMTAPSTEMQEAAAAYFDEMAEKYLIDASNQGKDIIVTGHSKGGNEAQYTYMAARHEEIIDNCISLDGQGFSQSAIDNFKKRFGDEYEDKLQNMYSVNGENDFVHDLGIPIIPEENTYFVPTAPGKVPDSWHALENMISDEDGNFTNLNWSMDENGITHGEQGPIGKLAKKISEEMMKMDPEDLHGAAVALMAIVDPYAAEDILGSVQISDLDYLDLLANGLPVALTVLLTTPEGWGAIQELLPGLITSIYNQYGIGGTIGIIAAGAFALAIAAVLLPVAIELLQLIDLCVDIINGIANIADQIINFVTAIKDAVVEAVQKISMGLRTYTAGYKAATANPQIEVDTFKLDGYAQRLSAVNTRISNLDSRLDSLYWRVGLQDLWDLMQADFLTGYSWRLSKCANYLRETALDFSKVESDLEAKIR